MSQVEAKKERIEYYCSTCQDRKGDLMPTSVIQFEQNIKAIARLKKIGTMNRGIVFTENSVMYAAHVGLGKHSEHQWGVYQIAEL